MKFATSFMTGLAAVGSVAAAPLAKRDHSGDESGNGINDAVVLQYALTLEHLENTFYSQALDKFDEQAFSEAGFNRTLISNIGRDESAHVDFLSGALKKAGETPTKACEYDFGYDDINGFMATASILEGVGVSAYLGAAASIANKAYLTAAGSILTVEARHSAYVRNELGQIPFPEPFDVPLDFNEVYSLAALFIKSCPESNPSLPVKAFPVLTASMADDGSAKLTPEDTSVLEGDGQLYAIWIGSNGNQVGDYNKDTMTVEWPYEQFGQRYVVLSTSKDVSDDTVVAGPAIYEIPGSPSS